MQLVSRSTILFTFFKTMIMVRAAFINPLSEEGKEIVRELRDLNRVFDEIEELIETVIESKS